MTQAIRVLTEVPAEQIIRDGGTGNWSAAIEKVKQYPYALCVRHGNRPMSPSDAPHKAAFLIGHISGVHETNELDGKGNNRIFISFDKYAWITVPECWGDSQNPVGYIDLEEYGIYVSSLYFESIENIHFVGRENRKGDDDSGLTFAQAREGLARRYGVDARAIEIIIRG